MLLSDHDIRAGLRAGRIRLTPLDASLVQPASIDIRLDRLFRLFDNHRYAVIDPAADQSDLTHLVDVGPDQPFVLHPGEFVLGSSYERVELGADIAARLEGKSSLGRLGLLTHATAGFIDPGFCGHVTLELSNTATMPLLLYPGMRVGQLCFFDLSSAAERPYGSASLGSHYQDQRGPTPSRSHLSFARTRIVLPSDEDVVREPARAPETDPLGGRARTPGPVGTGRAAAPIAGERRGARGARGREHPVEVRRG